MDAVAVDVAYWDLARQRSRLAALSALLSPEENARVARLAIPMLRERYVLAHGILRETLAAMTGEAPAALRFERGPDGKPALVGGRDIAFNLSKSGDGLLIATARGAAVGCDLEQLRPNSEAKVDRGALVQRQASGRRWRRLERGRLRPRVHDALGAEGGAAQGRRHRAAGVARNRHRRSLGQRYRAPRDARRARGSGSPILRRCRAGSRQSRRRSR